MKKMLLQLNTGHVRHAPHQGVICSTFHLLVTVTDQTCDHNGTTLVKIIDANNEENWIDPWFLRPLEA